MNVRLGEAKNPGTLCQLSLLHPLLPAPVAHASSLAPAAHCLLSSLRLHLCLLPAILHDFYPTTTSMGRCGGAVGSPRSRSLRWC